ncbi:MAG: hypothetical protein P8183_08210 [Anaerolineae bacterium]|jgi:hypothetical protein
MTSIVRKQGIWTATLLLFVVALSLAAGTEPVQAQQSVSVTTYAAYQEFEHGFMVWREDSGEILAFARWPNVVYRFPEASYDHLANNPAPEEPPSGLVKPIRGFGRVWGNFSYVRSRLGWGTISEFGYTATASIVLGYPNWEQITLPDGAPVNFLPNNSWSQTAPPLPTTPPPVYQVTSGAFQAFERGIMLYAANSGTIWVLTDSGVAHTFRSQDYGYLPENPVWEAPPSGYVRPILGFGKVWGNFPNIRSDLGWAVMYEDGYQMWLNHNANFSQAAIQLPDGQWIDIATNGSWQYR